MKKNQSILVTLLAAGSLLSAAQTPGKPAPEFSLGLSTANGLKPGEIRLVPIYTNITDSPGSGRTCAEVNLYYLEIFYNGVDITQSYHQETGLRGAEPCGAGPSKGAIPAPRAILHGTLWYTPDKPGTYQFTVVQDTYPGDPSKNVSVRSNTVTIVVPQPASTESN